MKFQSHLRLILKILMKYRQFQPRYSYKVYSCKKIVYILTFSFFQIQELGLQQQYNNNRRMYRYLRQIMALAFPPEDEIEPMFEHLKAQAATDQLRQFVEYMSQTWIHNQTWPPSSWSVYMMAIRSNNDIEGWHHGLHHRASGKWHMPFFMLLDLLHPARLTALRIRLVSKKKLERIQRVKYRSLQAKVFAL